MSKTVIGIIDYLSGNTQSVVNAVQHLNYNYLLCSKEEHFAKCSHLILPGVGSFANCMNALKESNIISLLNEHVINQKKYFLGICVGMQILATQGLEFGEFEGLGWVDGQSEKLKFDSHEYHLPHVGWNEINNSKNMRLFVGLPDNPCFYFVHSYAISLSDGINGEAYAIYGKPFLAALEKENVFGVQFHPEKSQKHGLKVLENFCNL